MFIRHIKTSQYAWNSTHIDDAGFMRSVTALGREFQYPLDMELLKSQTLNPINNKALFKYLLDVSMKSTFATEVLQMMVGERRTAHRKLWNNGNEPQLF